MPDIDELEPAATYEEVAVDAASARPSGGAPRRGAFVPRAAAGELVEGGAVVGRLHVDDGQHEVMAGNTGFMPLHFDRVFLREAGYTVDMSLEPVDQELSLESPGVAAAAVALLCEDAPVEIVEMELAGLVGLLEARVQDLEHAILANDRLIASRYAA